MRMSSGRNEQLDFVKGYCVVAMLIHHTLNCFPLPGPLLLYMRFVTGAFVFLSGFVVTQLYLAKYGAARRTMYLRLLVRAGKLLAMFAAINLFVFVLQRHRMAGGKPGIFNLVLQMFVTGDYRTLTFDLLVPIAYALILSGALVWFCQKRLALLQYLGVALVLASAFYHGPGSYYLKYTSCGILGAVVGTIPTSRLAALLKGFWVIIPAYVTHLALLPFIGLKWGVYLVVMVLNLMFAYVLGAHVPYHHYLVRACVSLGQYSLLAYFAQIAILQVLRRSFLDDLPLAAGAGIAFALTTVLTIAVVEITHRQRARWPWFNRGYRLVFN